MYVVLGCGALLRLTSVGSPLQQQLLFHQYIPVIAKYPQLLACFSSSTRLSSMGGELSHGIA
jgi:hypothetical protein